MLNDHGPTRQQPLLTDAAPNRRETGTSKAAEGTKAGVVTNVPEWLRDELQDYAATHMPNASWNEVVLLALAAGLGALDGVQSARRLNGFAVDSATAPAPAPVEPEYPFDRKHIPAFKALFEAVEAGPLTLDAVAVEAITGRMGSDSLRGVGTFLAGLARKSPVMGLRVEALGRRPRRTTMDYRLSREGSTG